MEQEGKYSKNLFNNSTHNRINSGYTNEYSRSINRGIIDNNFYKCDYAAKIGGANRFGNVGGGTRGTSNSSAGKKENNTGNISKNLLNEYLVSRMKSLSQLNNQITSNIYPSKENASKKDSKISNDYSSIYSKFSTNDNTYYPIFENNSSIKEIDNTNRFARDSSSRYLQDKNKLLPISYPTDKKELNDKYCPNTYRSISRANRVCEQGDINSYARNKFETPDEKETICRDKAYNNLSKEKSLMLFCNSKIGLDNLGNTCYMNTSLQCLIHCEPFMSRFLAEKEKYFRIISVRPTPISRAFYDLCESISSKIESSKSAIAPLDFKRIFSQQHNNFAGYQQHDTQEFLRHLLEDISEELNNVINIAKYMELDTTSSNKIKMNQDFDKLFRSREQSIVIDTFYGQLVNRFKCMECSYETYSFEKLFDIPLLLEKDSYSGFELSDLLNEYFKNDKFNWDTPCDNKRCKKKSLHEKSSRLSILPEILVLSLQRYNMRYKTKSSSRVKLEETLDISEYVDRECIGSIKSRYNLFAVSNHTGNLDYGHYYAYVKLNDGWFEFNDSYVSKISNFAYDSNTAYILFYIREGI